MTNTSEAAAPLSDALHNAMIEKARALGAEHGHNVGTWVEVTDDDTARALVRMSDDGDPEWDDASGYRSPLSGEWADDLTPDQLLSDLDVEREALVEGEADELYTAYEEAHRDAFNDEVLRKARYQLDGDDD